MIQLAVVFCVLAIYYIGPVGYISYIISILHLPRFKTSYWDIACISLILVGLSINAYFINMVELAFTARFFLGFFVFYVFFRSCYFTIDMEKVLLFLATITLCEALLINTIISPEQLPNYPIVDGKIMFGHNTEFFGFYQRPYSFGANASVTSNLLIALLAFTETKKLTIRIATILAVIVSISGSGYLSMFIYYLIRKPMKAIYGIVMVSIYAYNTDYAESIINKADPRYFSFLIDFKLDQLTEFIPDVQIYRYLFGFPVGDMGYGGDFGFLSFGISQGILILAVFLLFILSKINRTNATAIIIMMIGTFHYSVMFYVPGQLILALLLTQKNRVDYFILPDSSEKHSIKI